jgi:hypothetical protein
MSRGESGCSTPMSRSSAAQPFPRRYRLVMVLHLSVMPIGIANRLDLL